MYITIILKRKCNYLDASKKSLIEEEKLLTNEITNNLYNLTTNPNENCEDNNIILNDCKDKLNQIKKKSLYSKTKEKMDNVKF